MTKKFDYQKAYKELYQPKEKPMLVDVPEMTFIMVDGSGSPKDEDYQSAVEVLYALSYTIKMTRKEKSRQASSTMWYRRWRGYIGARTAN